MIELETVSLLLALVALLGSWWSISNYRGALEYQTGRTINLGRSLTWMAEQMIRLQRSLVIERRKVKQLEELQELME